MLRNFLGLPSLEKKRTAAEQRSQYDKHKRQRTIVPSWKQEFAWLVTDETSNQVFCKTCRSVYGPLSTRKVADRYKKYANGPFVSGSKNLRHDSLVTHQKSDGHKIAEDYVAEKDKQAKGQSTAEKCVMSLKLKGLNVENLAKLFRVAHALAKKCKPISDFVWMNDLFVKNGCPVGSSYRNAKSCKEFMVSIAEVERQKIESVVKDAKFLTVMSDGSTDVSVIENEIVYIHFCLHGTLHTYFLGLMECENANAEGIYMSILRALSFDCLCEEQIENSIVGFAADGASVNTGKCNGVIALFRRRINPNIVMVKCMSHRIELAYKDAMKKSPLYMKVFTLLDELFKFYGKSPKQMSGLKASFEGIKQQQILPTRVGGTRWIGHLQTALRSMFKGYKGYLVHLEKVAAVRSGSSATQSKAKFLLKQLKAKDVMMFAHFVKDVVNVLSKLSKFMQARTTGVYQVHRELHNTITSLEKLETRPGPELRLFQQELQTEQSFQGYVLEGSDAKCPEHISKILEALVSSMSGRFNDIDNVILEATRIADLGSWPASFTEALDFGDQ